MHCWGVGVGVQEPILKIWLQIVVKAGAINFDALHQLLYLFLLRRPPGSDQSQWRPFNGDNDYVIGVRS